MTRSASKPTQMIAMLRDISDRVEHRRELEEKIERLDRFASVISHDLRNPLSIISGHATLAKETGRPEHFETIEEAVPRMDDMLSDLLRLTREGDIIGDRTTVDVEALARRAWTDRNCPAGTLEIHSSRTITADPDRMCELSENLFENALEHAGEDVTIRVGTIETADQSGFYIEDNGVGIPPAERDTVFEWGQISTADGTGFSLAIVAEIVAAHGWEIDIADRCIREVIGGDAGIRLTELPG